MKNSLTCELKFQITEVKRARENINGEKKQDCNLGIRKKDIVEIITWNLKFIAMCYFEIAYHIFFEI